MLGFTSYSVHKLLYHALATYVKPHYTMLVCLLVHGIYIMVETDKNRPTLLSH